MLKCSQKRIATVVLWGLLLLLSANYFFEDIQKYLGFDVLAIGERKLKIKWWLIGHFTAASCTLFLGPLQFMPFVRKRYPRFHRISGKLYIVGSLISALTVYVLLGTYTLPGAIPSLGLLATLWIFTTLMAYVSIKKHRVKQHQQFMIRSYVCSIAFVFIRLLPEVNTLTGLFDFIKDQTMRSTVYEWICWVYPLIITEFFLTWKPQMTRRKTK